MEDRVLRKRLITAGIAIITIFIVGILGYHIIEGWDFLDSLWMTVITLATIGYGEIHPLSVSGRVFTIFLILSGLGIMGYGFSIVAAFIVEGELARLIGKRRMEKEIQKLSNHYIVCGAGETGRCIIEEFVKTKTPLVVIENDEARLDMLRNYEVVPYIAGDATKDASLISAGIHRAKGLVSTLHSDRDNVFVVLTARSLNANLRIVSSVIEPESERKLLVAGADSVVSPNSIGGMRMASIMIRPTVVGFLDKMLREQSVTIRLEEIGLLDNSPIIGKSIRHSDIRRQTGLNVMAIKRQANDQYILNPQSDTIFESQDVLIVMGNIEQIVKLRKLVGSI